MGLARYPRHLIYCFLTLPLIILGAQVLLPWLQLGAADVVSVLELGCGPGNATELFACAVGPTVQRYVATDVAAAMVNLAAKRMATLPLVTTCVVDAGALSSFTDRSFQRIAANLCVMLCPDGDRAFAESARVLSTGGIAGYTIWGDPTTSNMFSLFSDVLEAMRAGGEITALEAAVMAAPAPRSNHALFTQGNLHSRILAAGTSA